MSHARLCGPMIGQYVAIFFGNKKYADKIKLAGVLSSWLAEVFLWIGFANFMHDF